MDELPTMYERYKQEIYRIGWRIQYKAKMINKRECLIYENDAVGECFSTSSDNKILIQVLLDSLSSDLGKQILNKIYLQDRTESEVARELKISQQAVNKWKRKMLKELFLIMNS